MCLSVSSIKITIVVIIIIIIVIPVRSTPLSRSLYQVFRRYFTIFYHIYFYMESNDEHYVKL